MGWASAGARHGLRSCVLGLTAVVAVLTITSDAADARHHRRRAFVHYRAPCGARSPLMPRAESYSPPSASIVVDGNTGEVLQESNPDALRHPASLTKIMTLYLLFERLQAGKIKLDTPLTVSAHAAEQAPTKLGLKPGQTIAVEDAIKAVVTRSANDAAVVIAENLGGGEDAFARLMTQKARALGMSRTTYVNASGLPDDDQVTTARDQALLGRAIQDRFPRYYRYFSTTSFVFHGDDDPRSQPSARVDGRSRRHQNRIYPRLRLQSRHFGSPRRPLHRRRRARRPFGIRARRAYARVDRHELQVGRGCAARRRSSPRGRSKKARRNGSPLPRKRMSSRADPTVTATASPRVMVGSSDPIRPLLVKTISYRAVTVQRASLAPMPVLVPVAPPPPQPAASQAASARSSGAAPKRRAPSWLRPSRRGRQSRVDQMLNAPRSIRPTLNPPSRRPPIPRPRRRHMRTADG